MQTVTIGAWRQFAAFNFVVPKGEKAILEHVDTSIGGLGVTRLRIAFEDDETDQPKYRITPDTIEGQGLLTIVNFKAPLTNGVVRPIEIVTRPDGTKIGISFVGNALSDAVALNVYFSTRDAGGVHG